MKVIYFILFYLFTNINFEVYAYYNKNDTEQNKVVLNNKKSIIFKNNFKNIKINAISPASSIETDKYSELKKLNSFLLLPEKMYENKIPYHSSNDKTRFNELKEAIYNDNKIIWTLRGGYGSARLYEKLEQLKKPEVDKIFIGYSDVTFLHLFFTQKWNWITIHGSTLSDLLDNDKDINNFNLIYEILNNNQNTISYKNIEAVNDIAKNSIEISGISTGGNLEIITNSIGTSWEIQTKNKIIFLEETNLKGYSLDRSLNHLIQANLLKDAKAIIFGDLLGSDENIEIALKRFSTEINVPVFKLNTFGHGSKNYPIILNTMTTVQLKNNRIIFNYNQNYFKSNSKMGQYAIKD